MLGTPATARSNDQVVYTWLVSGTGVNPLQINFGLLVDPLTITWLLIITGVGLLIHIYSAGYMEDDPSFWRFFSYLNLFIFAMVLLVAADNFLFLLVGWGLVGLASFLLIGFWYQRRAPVAAAQKAFVINVIGDFGLMLAIFLLFMHYGSLNYQDVFGSLTKVSAGSGTATAIALLLFVACAAKSAQLPLYMWLPDAMEGPTPVSALIHAATMVTAGVYLVARTHLLFTNAPVALAVVAGIGGATALFAATIALFQLDIKRVLAYSTISQLGYMFLGEGVGNFTSGVFHFVTHAFFKALLFLGAGAVIYALNHEQDMRKMGGLRYRMPITYWTFLAATLAISGVPPLAGFWSKDDILGAALGAATQSGNPWLYVLWGVGLLTAGLTAFYMFRLFFGVFWGNYRGEAGIPRVARHDEEEEEEVEPDAHGHHGAPSYYDIYEAPGIMTTPLVILGVLSVIGGIFGSFALVWLPKWAPLEKFLDPVLGAAPAVSFGTEWISTGLSIALALIGILVAWRLYGKGFIYKENKNALYQLVFNKCYVDEAFGFVLAGILAFARACTRFLEGDLLDGLARGIAWLLRGTSSGLRRLQTGYMRNYALAILLGVVLIVVYYAVRG
jgi:NADH-quinone oxidoreductase subunit L